MKHTHLILVANCCNYRNERTNKRVYWKELYYMYKWTYDNVATTKAGFWCYIDKGRYKIMRRHNTHMINYKLNLNLTLIFSLFMSCCILFEFFSTNISLKVETSNDSKRSGAQQICRSWWDPRETFSISKIIWSTPTFHIFWKQPPPGIIFNKDSSHLRARIFQSTHEVSNKIHISHKYYTNISQKSE